MHLYRVLEINDILYSFQFGFCNGHPTNHVLANLTENIKPLLNNNKCECGIFINLQKTFVKQNIRLSKSKRYEIRESHFIGLNHIRMVANSFSPLMKIIFVI